jgi:hypothetical protein
MYSPDNHPVMIPFRMWVCSWAGVTVSHEVVTVAVAGTVIGTVSDTVSDTVSGSYWYIFWYSC